MKFIIQLSTIAAILTVSFLVFTSSQQQVSRFHEKSLKPEERYFLSQQFPFLGEGLEVYKRAVLQELKKIKKSRVMGNAWQQEGPFNTGGRINCIAVHPTQSNTYLIGCADGGVFKTLDGGQTWSPIFDQAYALSISQIVYEPNNPSTIYVGTGDQVLGGYSHNGNGIYKSTDGGNTWAQIGLGNTGVVGKIHIDPSNPAIIYAGTTGNPFISDNNRGVYKSTDTGQTWNQILYLGSNAGIGDMVINANNPSILYATGRRRFRSNQSSIITGPEAKIYRSMNGGTTWDTLSNGLPSGDQCRIGLCISKNNPNTLYANYVDTTLGFGGLYKTTNGGNSWSLVNNSFINMGNFGWYFGEIRLDPNNDNTLFLLSIDLYKSTDGGANFNSVGFTHADKHDLQFLAGNNLLLATDGGFYKSSNGGSSWTISNNIPITQFYEVAYNPFDSLNYYGGAQDNGTNLGSLNMGLNSWMKIYGGDGFRPQFNYTDSSIWYASWQNGNIVASTDGGNLWNNMSQSVITTDRTSWNTPYMVSRFNPDYLYMGSYRMYKNLSGPVDAWYPISGDLTDGINSTFNIISTIDQSPFNGNLLYAGTSDANLWVTNNDGSNWTQINAGLPNRFVSSVIASPNDSQHVFVSLSGYRNNDTLAHIYFSNNRGNSWNSIAGNLPAFAINDIWVKSGNHDSCIVVATDGGVYASENLGISWERVGTNMPIIPVFDLDYNPATKRLFAGTFARSMQSMELDSIFKTKPQINTSLTPISKTDIIKIYPNPCQSTFSIQSQSTIQEIQLFDFQGRHLQTYQMNQAKTFDCQQYPNGLYLVSIKTDIGKQTKPLQINK